MDKDEIIIITKTALLIRLSVEELRVVGRVTQGVKLINVKANDSIAAVTCIKFDENDIEDEQSDLEMSDETAENYELENVVVDDNSDVVELADNELDAGDNEDDVDDNVNDN